MAITIDASTIVNHIASNGSYQFSGSKKVVKLNQNAETTVTNTASFKKALRALKNLRTDNEAGATAATKTKVKNFVDSYNNVLSSAHDIKGSKKLEKNLKKLENLIDDYADDLKSVGITKSANNKLKFDTTNWSNVTGEKIKTIFGSDSAFLTDAVKYTRSVSNIASDLKAEPTDEFYTTTIDVDQNNAGIARSLKSLTMLTRQLGTTSFSTTANNDIVALITDYVNTYNDTLTASASSNMNTTATSYLSGLKSAATSNASALHTIGISVASNGSLSYADTNATANDYANVFADTASYNRTVHTYATKLFDNVVKADNAGVSVNYYA